MFFEQLNAAIDGAKTLAQLEGLSAALWKGFSAGAFSDEEAQKLSEILEARRTAFRASYRPIAANRPLITLPPKKPPQRSPNRQKSIQRRRQLAASGPLPPQLAAKFTTGELAVLKIIGDEVREKGKCDRSIAEIAARAGVCRTTAQNAIRQAARLGLLIVQERRQTAWSNLPNLIRIISREWNSWLAKRPQFNSQLQKGGGFKKIDGTDNKILAADLKRPESANPQRPTGQRQPPPIPIRA